MKFFNRQNFHEVISGFQNGLKKYPLTLFFSCLMALFTFLRLNFDIVESSNASLEMCILVSCLMIPYSFSFYIFRQQPMRIATKVMLFLTFLTILWTSYSYLHETSMARLYLVTLALIAVHCLVACSFLKFEGKYFFWNTNILMLNRFIFAALVSFLGTIGVMGVVSLFYYLILEKSIGETLIQAISCAGIVLHTWVFVSGCNFENLNDYEKNSNWYNKLRVFLQYVYIPLVVLYAAILILYLIKITVTFNLPKGGVAYYVVSLSGFGILGYFLGFRFTHTGESPIFSWFKKYFFYLLCPLLALLWVATLRRLMDYGISPDRYLLLIIAVWLTLMTVYILVRQSEYLDITPPITLWAVCIVMLLTPLAPTQLPVQMMSKYVHKNLINAQQDPKTPEGLRVISSVRAIHSMKGLKWMEKEFQFNIEQVSRTDWYDAMGKILMAMKLQPNEFFVPNQKYISCNRSGPQVLKNVHAKILIPNAQQLIFFNGIAKKIKFVVDGKEYNLKDEKITELLTTCKDRKIPYQIVVSENPKIVFYPQNIRLNFVSDKLSEYYDFDGVTILE